MKKGLSCELHVGHIVYEPHAINPGSSKAFWTCTTVLVHSFIRIGQSIIDIFI